MSRIGQVANFVAPHSGGLRTTLAHLAAGYGAAGHDVVQVVPGRSTRAEETEWGRRVTVRSPEIPGTGYRLIVRPDEVCGVLESMGIDRLEVHDRTTLRGLGTWARSKGVRSLVVNHERLDRVLAQWLPPRLPIVRAADRANTKLAAAYDRVVCTTDWAAEEFRRIGVQHISRVPLGVDLGTFTPRARTTPCRWRAPGESLLVMVSRLSKEKRPELAVEAVRELRRRGRAVRLVVVGEGPMRTGLEHRAGGLPVHFLGFVSDRSALAELLAGADVTLAPGPAETFGLAALESLAAGTPAVVNIHSALAEVVADSGVSSPSTPRCFADAVEQVLEIDPGLRRAAARSRAELFPWSTTVAGFLQVHGLPQRVRSAVTVPA